MLKTSANIDKFWFSSNLRCCVLGERPPREFSARSSREEMNTRKRRRDFLFLLLGDWFENNQRQRYSNEEKGKFSFLSLPARSHSSRDTVWCLFSFWTPANVCDYACQKKKGRENLFFSKRKESHTQTAYCIKSGITITSLSNKYFNIYTYVRSKTSK